MEKLKELLGGALGFVFLLALLAIPAALIWGGVYLAGVALPWLAAATVIQFFVTVVFLVPLAFFRGTRLLAGRGIRFFSYMFGLTVWLWGLAVTYLTWGAIPVFVGLFIFGVGVVPMGIVAYAVEGLWSPMLQLLVGVIMVFVTRALGLWLIEKAETEGLETEP